MLGRKAPLYFSMLLFAVDGTARPMIAGIAGCAVVALVMSWITLGGVKQAATA